VVTDILPLAVSFVSSTPAPASQNNNTNVYLLGNLAPGATTIITMKVTVVSGTIGQITNTVAVSPADPDAAPGDNMATAVNSVPDTDADGDPDFTDPDDDNDGASDNDETVADTDPFDTNSILKILMINTNGLGFDIQWQGGVIATQYVERSVSLVPPSILWTTIFTNPPPTLITNLTLDAAVTTNSRYYYRIRANQ